MTDRGSTQRYFCHVSEILPNPRYYCAAKLTPAFLYVIGRHKIAVSLDKQLFANMAISVVAFMAGDIADINIAYPFFYGEFPELR